MTSSYTGTRAFPGFVAPLIFQELLQIAVSGSEICSTNFLRKQWSALSWPADKFGKIKSSRTDCSTRGSLRQALAVWKPTSSKSLSGLCPKSEKSREHCQRWFLPSQGSRGLCRFLSVPTDERKSPVHSEYVVISWVFLCVRGSSCTDLMLPTPETAPRRFEILTLWPKQSPDQDPFLEISFSGMFLHVSPCLASYL